jgi:hypothetical protein
LLIYIVHLLDKYKIVQNTRYMHEDAQSDVDARFVCSLAERSSCHKLTLVHQ